MAGVDSELGGPGEKDERPNQGHGSEKEGSGKYIDLGFTNTSGASWE